MADGPLAGYRILEIAGLGPGPFAAMLLAAHARADARDRLRRACDRAARALRGAEPLSA